MIEWALIILPIVAVATLVPWSKLKRKPKDGLSNDFMGNLYRVIDTFPLPAEEPISASIVRGNYRVTLTVEKVN